MEHTEGFVVPSSLMAPALPTTHHPRRVISNAPCGKNPLLSNYRKIPSGILGLVGKCYSVEAALHSNVAYLLGETELAMELAHPNLHPEHAEKKGRALRHNQSPAEQVWLQEVEPHLLRALLYQKYAIQWLRDTLLQTGETELVLAGSEERYWGVGQTAQQLQLRDPIPCDALNWFGRLMGEVRTAYRSQTPPWRRTLAIGDGLVSGLRREVERGAPFALICRPGASLQYLLTLAEACACPGLQHVVVGGGAQDVLPPMFPDQPVPSARSLACAVVDTATRFRPLAPRFTYVPPVLRVDASEEAHEKLAQVYDDLSRLRLHGYAGRPAAHTLVDLSDVWVYGEGSSQEEPKLPTLAHEIVIEHLEHIARTVSIPVGVKCTCGHMWCGACFQQAQN